MGYIKPEEVGIGWTEKSKEDQTVQEEAKEKPMSPFEQMMLVKMDELLRIHKEDYT